MSNPDTDSIKTASNQSSHKLLSLMEYMSSLNAPIRLLDLASGLNMNTSTTLRFLNTLQERGYVVQEPDTGRYSMTYEICRLANNLTKGMDLRNISLTCMRKLSNLFECTSNLIVRYHYKVLYLEVIPGPGQVLIPISKIGNVNPLYCTGGGKILLKSFSEAEWQEYEKCETFTKITEKTIDSIDELRKDVELSARRGYAIDDEECVPGTKCVAMPVYDYTGKVCASISINGSTTKITDDFIKTNAPILKSHVLEVSRALGYKDPK